MIVEIYVADICIAAEAQIYRAKAIHISPVSHDVILCQPAHEFTDNGFGLLEAARDGTRCTLSISLKETFPTPNAANSFKQMLAVC